MLINFWDVGLVYGTVQLLPPGADFFDKIALISSRCRPTLCVAGRYNLEELPQWWDHNVVAKWHMVHPARLWNGVCPNMWERIGWL
jgi:hypothetical protein